MIIKTKNDLELLIETNDHRRFDGQDLTNPVSLTNPNLDVL